MTALLVALAGGCGTLLRYYVNVACAHVLGDAFPYSTFTVNVVGSFLLGLVSQLGANTSWFGVPLPLLLGTGVLGGFTTYSSFNLETLKLIARGEHLRAASYVVLTLLTCLAAGAVGIAAGRAAPHA